MLLGDQLLLDAAAGTLVHKTVVCVVLYFLLMVKGLCQDPLSQMVIWYQSKLGTEAAGLPRRCTPVVICVSMTPVACLPVKHRVSEDHDVQGL